MEKVIKIITSLLVLFGVIFGAYRFIDTTYAKSEEVKNLEQRLDYWITYDQYRSIQERIWKLEDRYGKIEAMPDEVKEEYRKLLEDKELIKKKIEKLIDGGKHGVKE